MTTAQLKRVIMREFVPYYGKRGMGWANPKKAAYNHLYNMVTANPIDVVFDYKKINQQTNSIQIPQIEYEEEVKAIATYQRGLKQCDIPIALINYIIIMGDILNESPMHKAIRLLNSYVGGYCNKSMRCGYDYCDMCEERLENRQRINPRVKYIAIEIVRYIRQGMNANEIYSLIAHYSYNQNVSATSIENSSSKESSLTEIKGESSSIIENCKKQNATEKWYSESIGYKWAIESVLKGMSRNEIVSVFNKQHLDNPKDYSTMDGKPLNAAILCGWIRKAGIIPPISDKSHPYKKIEKEYIHIIPDTDNFVKGFKEIVFIIGAIVSVLLVMWIINTLVIPAIS